MNNRTKSTLHDYEQTKYQLHGKNSAVRKSYRATVQSALIFSLISDS